MDDSITYKYILKLPKENPKEFVIQLENGTLNLPTAPPP